MCSLCLDNIWSSYSAKGDVLERGSHHSPHRDAVSNHFPYVFADITTSFTLLIGIFFPSVTGNDNSRLSYLFI